MPQLYPHLDTAFRNLSENAAKAAQVSKILCDGVQRKSQLPVPSILLVLNPSTDKRKVVAYLDDVDGADLELKPSQKWEFAVRVQQLIHDATFTHETPFEIGVWNGRITVFVAGINDPLAFPSIHGIESYIGTLQDLADKITELWREKIDSIGDWKKLEEQAIEQ